MQWVALMNVKKKVSPSLFSCIGIILKVIPCTKIGSGLRRLEESMARERPGHYSI